VYGLVWRSAGAISPRKRPLASKRRPGSRCQKVRHYGLKSSTLADRACECGRAKKYYVRDVSTGESPGVLVRGRVVSFVKRAIYLTHSPPAWGGVGPVLRLPPTARRGRKEADSSRMRGGGCPRCPCLVVPGRFPILSRSVLAIESRGRAFRRGPLSVSGRGVVPDMRPYRVSGSTEAREESHLVPTGRRRSRTVASIGPEPRAPHVRIGSERGERSPAGGPIVLLPR